MCVNNVRRAVSKNIRARVFTSDETSNHETGEKNMRAVEVDLVGGERGVQSARLHEAFAGARFHATQRRRRNRNNTRPLNQRQHVNCTSPIETTLKALSGDEQ